MSHGSGDYVIAFSTHSDVRVPYQSDRPTRTVRLLRDETLSPLFQAVREASEEAIVNSLLRATTMTGFQGHRCEAIPLDRVTEICRRHGTIPKCPD
jgi:D-aminopeptidase